MSNEQLFTSDMQFAFKKNHSTSHCTFVLNEVIQYYLNKSTNVHAIFLDASKAFDKVEYVKLFRLLFKRGLCPLIIRFLINMYTSQSINVNWNGCVSNVFKTQNGVKQGGVLSPILFTIYFDELLSNLESSGVGCFVGNTFMGALAYADDVVILAQTKTAVNILLSVASKFAKEYNVVFNAKKTKYVYFGNVKNVGTINFEGVKIVNSKTENHLGNIVGPHCNLDNIIKSKRDLIIRNNEVFQRFKFVKHNVLYYLFKTYCMSLYGCQLWDVSGNDIKIFYVAWRKSIRMLFKLPYKTHCNILHEICCDVPIDFQVHKRIIKFINNIALSNNTCINIAYRLMLNGSNSSVSNSFSFICEKYRLCRYNLNLSMIHDKNISPCSRTIVDMLNIRDGVCSSIITKDEATKWIDILCTN